MIQKWFKDMSKCRSIIKFSQWNFIALFSLNLMQMIINHTFKCRYFMWRLSCNNFIFHVCTRSNIWTIPKIMHGMRECMICYHFMWYFHHFMWGEIKQKLSSPLSLSHLKKKKKITLKYCYFILNETNLKWLKNK